MREFNYFDKNEYIVLDRIGTFADFLDFFIFNRVLHVQYVLLHAWLPTEIFIFYFFIFKILL
jgi:hypothetical protein